MGGVPEAHSVKEGSPEHILWKQEKPVGGRGFGGGGGGEGRGRFVKADSEN